MFPIAANAAALLLSAQAVLSETTRLTDDAQAELVLAQALVEDTGAADRIRVADRLRTLSQEIPAATCHLHNHVEADANRYLLSSSIEQFDVILDALLNGNPDLHIIGAEERLKTIREIEAIMAEFDPIRAASLQVLDAPDNTEAVQVIYEATEHLLETISHLLSELEGEYARPTEILQADVMLLEISGRQAMHTQRLAFEACRIWSGDARPDEVDDMAILITRFDVSVRALLDGRPELGINPAPTDEIRAALQDVISDWDDTAAALTNVVENAEIPADMAGFICRNPKKKMDKLEHIVDLYTEYSRRAYQGEPDGFQKKHLFLTEFEVSFV